MKKFDTITCEEIMTMPLKPISFFVDKLIAQGLYILAGAPKIGKSWLALDICLSISKGQPVLSRSTIKGTALYLCLEDSKVRIQNRLYEMTDEPADDLHFALLANSIGRGLEEQIENFLSEHHDTKIIIIDTLQKIRDVLPENAYAADYKELSSLKSIADRHGIAIVLVHHLRKTKDSDPFNMISGTTGISGCVDGSFVLAESKRGSRTATLFCVGRDIENAELELTFDSAAHRWVNDETVTKEKDIFSFIIHDAMMELGYLNGTPAEVTDKLQKYFLKPIYPNRITRDLVQHAYELQLYGVNFSSERSHGLRKIILEYDRSGDGSDGKILVPEVTVLPSPALEIPFDSADSAGDGSFRGDSKTADRVTGE